jgi:hypothetical protein
MEHAPDINAAAQVTRRLRELFKEYGIAKDVDAAGAAPKFSSAAIGEWPFCCAMKCFRDSG